MAPALYAFGQLQDIFQGLQASGAQKSGAAQQVQEDSGKALEHFLAGFPKTISNGETFYEEVQHIKDSVDVQSCQQQARAAMAVFEQHQSGLTRVRRVAVAEAVTPSAVVLGQLPLATMVVQSAGFLGGAIALHATAKVVQEATAKALQQACRDFSFEEMEVGLLQGIRCCGFERPTPIQKCALGHLIAGMDVNVRGRPCCGKSTALVAGTLQRIDCSSRKGQAILLAPTNELAQQIQALCLDLGRYLGVRSHLCVSGTSLQRTIDKLREGWHVVVGTPGRVQKLISKRHLLVDDVRLLVLDEADEMLSCTFKDQVYKVFKTLPPCAQVCLFSTMTPETWDLDLTAQLKREMVPIVEQKANLLEDFRQYRLSVEQEDSKLSKLLDICEVVGLGQTIIYCNTGSTADYLADQLSKCDMTASRFHEDLDRKERNRVMREFRSSSTRTLICSGPLARGIHFKSVDWVINYDLPVDLKDYIHRISVGHNRAATINFCTNRDVQKIQDIETYYHTHIEDLPVEFGGLIRA